MSTKSRTFAPCKRAVFWRPKTGAQKGCENGLYGTESGNNNLFTIYFLCMKAKHLFLTLLFLLGVGSASAATVTQTVFNATSGHVNNDANVSFACHKGGGTSNPQANSDAIRLYQSTSGTGGYVVISVGSAYKITSATIASTMATTTGYYLSNTDPGDVTPAKGDFAVSNHSLAKNEEYTVSGLDTRYITFACFGTTSSARLYLSKISVTYESSVTTPLTVTFDANGHGTAPAALTEATAGAGVTLPSMSASGYAFKGWATSASATTAQYQAGTTYKPTANTTLYAVWKAAYTITWMVGSTSSTTSLEQGEDLVLPTAPADNALGSCANKFMGWSATNLGAGTGHTAPADLFTSADDAPTISANTTFYAVFATEETGAGASGSITVNADGLGLTGSYASHTATIGGQSFEVYGMLNSQCIQVNSKKSGGHLYNTTPINIRSITVTRNSSESTTGTVTLYTSTSSNTQTHSLGSLSAKQSSTYQVTNGDQYFTLVPSGACQFSSIVINYGAPTTYSNYVTLCSTETYTVTFDAQGGTPAPSSLTEATAGAGVTLPNITTLPTGKCAFLGWSASTTSTDASTIFAQNTVYHPTQNITLYARYATSLATPTGLTASNLNASSASGASVTLSWNAVPNADSYEVEITDGGDAPVATRTVTTTTVTISALTPNTEYLWDVSAKSSSVLYCDSEKSTETGDFTTPALGNHTVTFMEQGLVSKTVSVQDGTTVDDVAPEPAICDSKYRFVGWSLTNLTAEVSDQPALVDLESYPITQNTTLYAIYQKTEAGTSGAYSKVTTVSNGVYIVATASTHSTPKALAGQSGSHSYAAVVDVTFNANGEIETLPAGAKEVTVQTTNSTGTEFSMFDGTSFIIGVSSETTIYNSTTHYATQGYWTLTSTGAIHSTAQSTRYLNFSTDRMANYASDTETNHTYLYKKSTSVITYTSTMDCRGTLICEAPWLTTGPVTDRTTHAVTQPTVSVSVSFRGHHLQGSSLTVSSLTRTAGNATMAVSNLTSTFDNSDATNAKVTGSFTFSLTPAAGHNDELVAYDLVLATGGQNIDGSPETFTIPLHGRILPQYFGIVAKDADGQWYALRGDMSGVAQAPQGEPVNLTADGKIEYLPSHALYDYKKVNIADSPDNLAYLVGAGGRLTAALNDTPLNNKTGNYEKLTHWFLKTTDGINYQPRTEEHEAPSFDKARRQLMFYYDSYNKTMRFGHVATSQQSVENHYKDIRFLAVQDTCTRLELSGLSFRDLKRSTVTLVWNRTAGAQYYNVYINNAATGTRVEVPETNPTTLSYTVTGLTALTTYTFTVEPMADGADNVAAHKCPLTQSVTVTTRDCDDPPQNCSFVAAASSLDVYFDLDGTGLATVNLFAESDTQGTGTPLYTATGTSPVSFTNLPADTKFNYQVVSNPEGCRSMVTPCATTANELDVVEWLSDGMVVDLGDGDMDDLTLTIGSKNYTSSGGAQTTGAEDLYFSKYFEAQGAVKLLGLFNPTDQSIDLTHIRIRGGGAGSKNAGNTGAFNGATTGRDYIDFKDENGNYVVSTIEPYQEIILISADNKATADTKIINCVLEQNVFNNAVWYPVGEGAYIALSTLSNRPSTYIKGAIQTGGNVAYQLERESGGTWRPLDIFGAFKANDDGTVDYEQYDNQTTVKNTETITYTMPDGTSVSGTMNDAYGWYCANGTNFATNQPSPLTTNRALLIRNGNIPNGKNAVASNIGDFATLCTEWKGIPISSVGSTKDVKPSCSAFGYVVGVDYAKTVYEAHYDNVTDPLSVGSLQHNADGTYTVNIGAETMREIACHAYRAQLLRGDEVINSMDGKIPIVVNQTTNTADPTFFNYIDYDHYQDAQGNTIPTLDCSTCDVVVRDNSTLTKAPEGTTDDQNTVHNIHVYPGSTLSIPASTTYNVNELRLRRKEMIDQTPVIDEVGRIICNGTLSFKNEKHEDITTTNPVCVEVRITPANWHFFSLPFDCHIDHIQLNGRPATLGTHFYILKYNGETRAATQSAGNWVELTSNEMLERGQGYMLGIAGTMEQMNERFILKFPAEPNTAPMFGTANPTEKAGFSLPVYAYGDSNTRPNHRGWNLIGNPYMDYYYTAAAESSFSGLQYGELEPYIYTDADGVQHAYWRIADNANKTIPYVVLSNNGGNSYYQELFSRVDLAPTVAYFVQVDGTGVTGDNIGTHFSASSKGRVTGLSSSAIIRRAPQTYEQSEEPVLVRLSLANSAAQTDVTTLVLDASYDFNQYLIGADMEKWMNTAYRSSSAPVLYTLGGDSIKRVFNAMSESDALNAIPVGYFAQSAGTYTFTLDRSFDLTRVSQVWLYDALQGTHTNLLLTPYTFTTDPTDGTGRFYLSVVLYPAPEVVTNTDNLYDSAYRLTALDHTLVLTGLNTNTTVWVYDATGKLIVTAPTFAYEFQAEVPASGTYFVRIQSALGTTTLSTIVK